MKGSITLKVGYDHEEYYLKVWVIDTGVGISEQDRCKLFSLFGKLKSTSTINTSGIGLGLTTCKKIVEAFDGSIELIESELNIGTTFAFKIKCYT